jgi:hypothetical protein
MSSSPMPPVSRVLVAACVLAMIAEAAYIGIARAVLASRIEHWASNAGVVARTKGLLSLYPGDLRAERLEIAFDSSKIALSSVRGDLRLASLLKGAVETQWLRARVVEFVTGGIALRGAAELEARGVGFGRSDSTEPHLSRLDSLRVWLHEGTVEFNGRSNVRLRGLELTYVASRHGSNALGTLSLDCDRVDLQYGAFEGPLAVRGATLLEKLEFRTPHVSLTRADVVLHSESKQPFSLELVIPRVEWSLSAGLTFTAASRAGGSDASILFDLLDVAPAVRWMLDALNGQPFTIATDAALSSKTLRLDNIVLSTEPASGRGAIRFEKGGRFGAMLFDRGRLRVGVAVDGKRTRVIPLPTPDWLHDELAQRY